MGLRFCARAFSSCGERGPLFIAVRGPLTIAASLVAEHRLQTRRLSNCGSRAQLLRGMWDLPRPGLEPVFPALAGRFSTTAPPAKPYVLSSNQGFYSTHCLSISSFLFSASWSSTYKPAEFSLTQKRKKTKTISLLPHWSFLLNLLYWLLGLLVVLDHSP